MRVPLYQSIRSNSFYDARAHERLRFAALASITILKLFNLFGGIWDIQWHVAIGRDSLFIPPHLMVMVAFVSGASICAWMVVQETRLARSGLPVQGQKRLGPFFAPPAFYGILLGYSGALLSGGFDEIWHRIFGIDASLWSPPHLLIMFFTLVVDYSLLLGLSTSARGLGWEFHWKNPYFWLLLLAGAYTFEAVNFQMAEAILVAFLAHGAGLQGLLFPILVGALFPMSLLLAIRLSGRFWIAALIFLLTLCLQMIGVKIAELGFSVLKPVSHVEIYVLLNPTSVTALARQMSKQLGFNGLIGYEQAWTMLLSGIPLALVSLLGLAAWPRRRPLVAAPLYGASLVLVAFIWFQLIPVLRSSAYHPWAYALLGAFLAAAAGLCFGWAGLRISLLVRHDP